MPFLSLRHTQPFLILAADIGATNSRFALFCADVGKEDTPLLRLEWEQWFKGAEYKSFSGVLDHLLAAMPANASGGSPAPIAVFAPAGPIQGGRCRLSNLPWLIDTEEVRERLGLASVFLINDFAAQAMACLLPDAQNIRPVLPGRPEPGAPIAVTGAGTGFGKAVILPGSGQHGVSRGKQSLLRRICAARVLASEGGHVDFPFIGAREREFADFICARDGIERPNGDAVVSGSGLARLVSWLAGSDVSPEEAPALALAMPEAQEMFARFFSRLCRNYVLDTLALGGLYIAGGMALRVPVLEHPAFAAEFFDCPSQLGILERVPVRHLRSQSAGLWGAALFGLSRKLQEAQTAHA